jgi:hypothetical protein
MKSNKFEKLQILMFPKSVYKDVVCVWCVPKVQYTDKNKSRAISTCV